MHIDPFPNQRDYYNAQGRWFPPGPKFMFTFGVNHFHVLSWSGNNTRELCCCLYSQPRSSQYCTLYCCRYDCYSFHFSFLSHLFTVSTYARSLTLARPLTAYELCAHTPYGTALFLKGVCHSDNNGNWRLIDRTWTPSSFSAETRWQVILFKFPIDWR